MAKWFNALSKTREALSFGNLFSGGKISEEEIEDLEMSWSW